MSNYNKVVVTTPTYSVTDMAEGSTPICDTKILSGSSWNFNSEELPATVYYESTSVSKPKTYVFASDSHHVEMSTNRTLEEEYTSLLGKFGKEIDSPDGSAIQVNDGISGKVLKMSIKGQTVKNILPTENIVVLTGDGTNWKTREIPLSKVALAPTKKYTLYTFVYENTLNYDFEINQMNPKTVLSPRVSIEPKKVGVFVNTLTSIDDFTGKQIAIRCTVSKISETGTIKFRQVLVEGENTNLITSYIPFGLSSTQAIISNNGQQYPIYEPTIQGKTRILDTDTGLVPTDPLLPPLKDGDVLDLATKTITFANKSTQVLTDEQVKAYSKYKKVISLPFSEDKVTLNGDGSATWVDKSNCKSNSELVQFPITNAGTQTATVKQYAIHVSDVLNSNNQINSICDNMNIYTADELIGFEKVGISSMRKSDAGFIVSVASSEVGTGTIEEFRQWLADANFNILYKTINEIQTHIPKELVPTVRTH